MPQFQSDAEHQVWLEAITRVVASAGSVSPYGMQLIQNYWRDGKIVTQTRKRTNGTVANDVQESRNSFVRDALLALAGDETDIDEDIMPSVPRDRLQFMTIHQAKGLEFPLVIVDVGSQFKIDSDKQRFLRFPDDISNVVVAEDDVEPHLSAPLRAGRPAMDRTFDDLARLYYVAYSRPQSVLLLVGCEKCLKYGKGKSLSDGVIRHIALGWNRDRTWPWRQAIPPGQRRPPVLVEPPIQLI
jgi:DNA helicase-2/ATP-dependent DNA helicase PcrA